MSGNSSGAVSALPSPIVRATIGLVMAAGFITAATLVGPVSVASADGAVHEGPAPVPSEQPRVARKVGDEPRLVPELMLDKTVDRSSVSSVGQLLTYRFVATNTGQTPLFNVRIVDELPGLSELVCRPVTRADLEPDDQLTCTATRPVTQDDLDLGVISNSARALGEAPGGNPADPSDDVAASGDVTVAAAQEPALTITESPTPVSTSSPGKGPLPGNSGVSPLILGTGSVLTLIGAGLVVRNRTRGRTRS